MANTYVDYTATAGQTDFPFSFPYLEDSHVVVQIDGVTKTLTTDYTISTSPSTKIVLVVAATAGEVVRVQRSSNATADYVDFVDGSVLTENDLDQGYRHNRYLNEEAEEGVNAGLLLTAGDSTTYNATGKKIINLADATLATDAANKGYIDTQIALTDTNLAGFYKSTHTGDNTTTDFTLSFTPQTTDAKAYVVTIDGVVQIPDTAYTVGATSITFTSAPPTSGAICVIATAAASVATVNEAQVTSTGSTTARSLASRFANVVNVLDYGAKGDGATDDTTALITASAAMTSGQTLYFPKGTYLVSRSGFSSFTDPYGNVVCALSGKDNVSVQGNGATIKVVSHDIAAYGGLLAFKFTNCNGIDFRGIHFDMTFTGYKNSGSYYPFCGGIYANNASVADGQDPEDLTENVYVSNCTFKLYHPLGCYGITGNPYGGDSNNGWKLFSVFVEGPNSAVAPENLSRNVTIRDCIIRKGHNGYGFWVWSASNAVFDNLAAEDFVNKATNVPAESIVSGFGGIPFIRHHQFNSAGAKVVNCNFRGKPSSERTTSGFEGASSFIHYTTNTLNTDSARGEYVTANNVIVMGLGDVANSINDSAIRIASYGHHVIANNVFDGRDADASNINSGTIAVELTPSTTGANGVMSAVVTGNLFGRWLKADNVTVYNSSNTSAAHRRLKQLIVTNNISMSQGSYFLRVEQPGTSDTYVGISQLAVSNNVIDGANSYYDTSSANSMGIRLQSNQAGDVYNVKNNQIKSKYYGIYDLTTNASVYTAENTFDTVTDHYATGNDRTESLGKNTQGTLTKELTGEAGAYVTVKENTSSEALSMYAQSATNQYIIASKRLNMYAENAAQIVLDDGILRASLNGDVALGSAAYRWGSIYTTDSAINGSDERLKQDVEELTDGELKVARALKGLIRKYKFKSAVEKKGADDARTHVGVIAQQVKEAFAAEGLDGFDYGVLCYDEWLEERTTDKDGNEVVTEAGDTYSIRYAELFAFIIAAL